MRTEQCKVYGHAPSANPRITTCVRCTAKLEEPAPVEKPTTPRNLDLERSLTAMCAKAGGHMDVNGDGDDRGLSAFADWRAWPGGVRDEVDWVREAREEVADLRNYLLWRVVPQYQAHLKGDPDATHDVAKCLRALTAAVEAWVALGE